MPATPHINAKELFGSERTLPSGSVRSLELAEALVAIFVLAAAADGKICEEEKWALSANHVRIFKSYSGEQFQELLSQVLKLIEQHSSSALFAAAKKALTPKLRQTAFAIAADLILADAVLTEEEKQFMIQLWHALEIPDEIGEKIIEVMNIKNFV
ncbi:MAG: tellurite resistance TerB family protein [Oscillatoria princeps RMCB-10]|jgi:uncharacterized membrane protein YebE (DUF533 family)|nr:tellurite resistance TerB family protein [Oscillatoria princeps RMCB-10]